jgi:hypothetical protein
MNKRRPIQEKHEKFLVDAFIKWWASHTNEHFNVISRPHPLPPEAIVQSEIRTTWIEVTDAFYSSKWAQDLYSYATPGETHKSMDSGPYVGMDVQTARQFIEVLTKKLSKKSYADVYNQHGPGILLIGMQSPWFNERICSLMHDECKKADWSIDRGYFSNVFISFSSLNQQTFEEWTWKAQHQLEL